MYTKYTLLLASQSHSRQVLLRQMQIPFQVIGQHADESACDWNLPLVEVVSNIALYKMQHAIVPDGVQEGEICFVLTADTLSQDGTSRLQGKPIDKQDAVGKIRVARQGSELATSFCIDKKIWDGQSWQLVERISQVVCASYRFDIPEEWIETYFQKSYALQCAGAVAIEDFGGQFLHDVKGSYSTIVGLPQFEVRQALEKLSFFNCV